MATETVNQDLREQCNHLDRKLAQLEALLHATYGVSQEGFDAMAAELRDNYMWACSDLAGECRALANHVSTVVYQGDGAQANAL